MFTGSLLYLLCIFPNNALTQSFRLAPRKSTSPQTYDPHIVCDSAGPSHAEGLPLAYSEQVYAELLTLCSAAHGARQNVGCFCPTSGGEIYCDRSIADSNLWTARFSPENRPGNQGLRQMFAGFGFPDGNIPFPFLCGSICECRTAREAEAWFQDYFNGVEIDILTGINGLRQPSQQPSGNADSSRDSFGAASLIGTQQAAAQPAWHNQCGNTCTSSKDCAVPAGENDTCTCQAYSSQYQPGPGTAAFIAACLVFLGSGGKREETLPCPCNRTYVSHGCCDVPDGSVWEPPDLKLGELVISTNL